MEDLPVACSLSATDLQQRRQDVLAHVQQAIEEVKLLEAGYALRFDANDATLAMLTDLIHLERTCCSFLTFTLRVAPANGPVWLELTGPEGTKAFLEELLLG